MIKIIVVSVVGCCIGVILKQNCKELLLPFYIGFSVVMLIFIADKYSAEISAFTEITESFGVGDDIIGTLVKASVVSVAVKISGDICKESGNLLMQDIIELGGRVVIFTLSLPYMLQIIRLCLGLLK